MVRSAINLLFGLLLFTTLSLESNAVRAQQVELQIVKAGFIVGLTGGRGMLYYEGRAYPLRVDGVSLGATFAVSSIDLTGIVSNLQRPEDIYGTYTASSAGVALAGGGKVAKLTNNKGVRMEVRGRTIGVEFSLDLSGIRIRARK